MQKYNPQGLNKLFAPNSVSYLNMEGRKILAILINEINNVYNVSIFIRCIKWSLFIQLICISI